MVKKTIHLFKVRICSPFFKSLPILEEAFSYNLLTMGMARVPLDSINNTHTLPPFYVSLQHSLEEGVCAWPQKSFKKMVDIYDPLRFFPMRTHGLRVEGIDSPNIDPSNVGSEPQAQVPLFKKEGRGQFPTMRKVANLLREIGQILFLSSWALQSSNLKKETRFGKL